jgi:catechol 2,3-dioxygenase-like lactoylglutathione lyase family enzyme
MSFTARPWAGDADMTAPIGFSHVVLKSFNIERMRDWYCNVLDAHVVYGQAGLSAFLTYDREHHRIAIVQLEGTPPPPSTAPTAGLLHLAYTFSNICDLLSQYAKLKKKHIEPISAVNHGLTISIYYVDPDNNRVELMIDRFATFEEGVEFMETPEFKRNPAGYEIDPADLVSRMGHGASRDELTAFAPPTAGLDRVWMKKHLSDMGLGRQ